MRTPNAIDQKISVSLELSEFGCGSIFIHAADNQQASNARKLLAEVTPELREIDAACKRAADKIGMAA